MYMQENYTTITNSYTTIIRPIFLSSNAKSFIEKQYLDLYSAKICVSYPYLAYINNNDNTLCAAGFRFAKNERLFLEQYLNKPIEEYADDSRDKIAEVGNLATQDYTKLFKMLYDLSAFLIDNDTNYIAITATNKLYKVLSKRGISGKYLADASINSLKHNKVDWGSYYTTEPKVYLFNLHDNIQTLKSIVQTAKTKKVIV